MTIFGSIAFKISTNGSRAFSNRYKGSIIIKIEENLFFHTLCHLYKLIKLSRKNTILNINPKKILKEKTKETQE